MIEGCGYGEHIRGGVCIEYDCGWKRDCGYKREGLDMKEALEREWGREGLDIHRGYGPVGL